MFTLFLNHPRAFGQVSVKLRVSTAKHILYLGSPAFQYFCELNIIIYVSTVKTETKKGDAFGCSHDLRPNRTGVTLHNNEHEAQIVSRCGPPAAGLALSGSGSLIVRERLRLKSRRTNRSTEGTWLPNVHDLPVSLLSERLIDKTHGATTNWQSRLRNTP